MISNLKEGSLKFSLRVWATPILLSPFLIAIYDFFVHFLAEKRIGLSENGSPYFFFAALFFGIVLGGLFSLPILALLTFSTHRINQTAWKIEIKKGLLAALTTLLFLSLLVFFSEQTEIRWGIIYWLTAVASIFFYKLPPSLSETTEQLPNQTSQP